MTEPMQMLMNRYSAVVDALTMMDNGPPAESLHIVAAQLLTSVQVREVGSSLCREVKDTRNAIGALMEDVLLTLNSNSEEKS